MFFHIDNETKISYSNLLKWLIFALFSGLTGALLVHYFVTIIVSGYTLILQHSPLPLGLTPILGAILVGGLIYKINPRGADESVPSYIRGIRLHDGKFAITATITQLLASLTGLTTLGSGGIVGPLGRINAGLSSHVLRRFLGSSRDADNIRTMAICGFAASVGAIFGSSLGAGVMAVEIIEKKRMGYKDLFPSILASTTAVWFSKLMGWNFFYTFVCPNQFMELKYAWVLIPIAISASLIGMTYIRSYAFVSSTLQRNQSPVIPKVVTGSILAAAIATIINPEIFSISRNFFPAIITNTETVLRGHLGNELPLILILLVMMIGKGAANIFTLASGMNVGIVGPIAIMGAMLGSIWSQLFHLSPGSPSSFAFIAAGFSGVLTSILNIPLATAIITIEIFGLSYSFPAALVTVISFQLTRSHTIYDVIEKDLRAKNLWEIDE